MRGTTFDTAAHSRSDLEVDALVVNIAMDNVQHHAEVARASILATRDSCAHVAALEALDKVLAILDEVDLPPSLISGATRPFAN